VVDISGSYTLVDANGQVKTVNYVGDGQGIREI